MPSARLGKRAGYVRRARYGFGVAPKYGFHDASHDARQLLYYSMCRVYSNDPVTQHSVPPDDDAGLPFAPFLSGQAIGAEGKRAARNYHETSLPDGCVQNLGALGVDHFMTICALVCRLLQPVGSSSGGPTNAASPPRRTASQARPQSLTPAGAIASGHSTHQFCALPHFRFPLTKNSVQPLAASAGADPIWACMVIRREPSIAPSISSQTGCGGFSCQAGVLCTRFSISVNTASRSAPIVPKTNCCRSPV
jgi:hypothetical protein